MTGVANIRNDVQGVARWQKAIVPKNATVVGVHMCQQLSKEYKCKGRNDVQIYFFSLQTCNTLVCI